MKPVNFDEGAKKFFEYSRKRYQILLNRRAGMKPPWTDDPVLREWSFCNILREDDKVTIWFRENIREPLRNDPSVLFATIAFRWFNSIEAGEVLKPWLLENKWPIGALKTLLEEQRAQRGKIVTGAYIIKTPPKLSKIDALLSLILKVREKQQELIFELIRPHCTLEQAWDQIRQLSYMGDFTSYEVVTDLRHTFFLENASDINLWANPGPGCAAGLGELFFNNRFKFNRHNKEDREYMIELMRDLLCCSKYTQYWPKEWPRWELREVEHTSCEIFKMLKARTGLRLKRRYKHG